jgi:hypothetical protein
MSDPFDILAKSDVLGMDMLRALGRNRLDLLSDRMRYPTIADQQIQAPIFVVGLPRSGTSLLHNLLASDSRARSVAAWQAAQLSPPPTGDTRLRISLCASMIESLPSSLTDIILLGAELPIECNSFTMPSFRSANFFMGFQNPEYARWYLEDDHAETYAFHRKVLQHLQAFTKGEHWVLKSPAHLLHMDALYAAYPDARVVYIRRDHETTMTSLFSLTQRHWEHSGGAPVDRDAVVSEMEFVWSHARQPDQCVAVEYDDLVGDPRQTVTEIYAGLGIDLLPDTLDRVDAFIAANAGRGRGKHHYQRAK